ncbi:MAG TPA: ester cyclase [Bryobacteraceae bacterium]|nr:ester cyclase [Bryobacteraceae bacterium]
MSIDENKRLILEHYESFVSKQDASAVREQLTQDFVDHEMPPGIPPGPEGAMQLRAMLHKAFPDFKIEIEDIVAEGDRVAVRAHWTGTHCGPLPMLPIPPANRKFAIGGMVFWRIREGKIAERWAVLDRAALMQQLAPQSQPVGSAERVQA